MLRLITAFRQRFFPEPPTDPQELQNSFRAHYQHFRGLLTANNNALELMAEAEQMLASGRPFGMAFVRGNCTALSVNVYKMIKHLAALSEGGYPGLAPRFKEISGRLEAILDKQPAVAAGPHILGLDQIDRGSLDLVGEKMANLGEIRNRLGLHTPDGFVITATAAAEFMAGDLQAEINRQLKSLNVDDLEDLYTTSAAVQQLISTAPLPEELETQIQRAYFQLAARAGGEVLVALRSSALGEDTMRVSFAGQYRTQLNVAPEFLARTYKEILAGKYKSQAIVYRQQRGYRHQDVVMCVGCLAMVKAVVSGVTYSRPPGDPRADRLLIHAVQGLANGAVDGDVPHELWRVARAAPHPVLASQSESSAPPFLTPAQLAELAAVAVRLEEHFGSPQDIEWSYDESGRLFILQSRPLGEPAEAAAESSPPPPPAETDLAPPLLAGGAPVSPGVACGVVFKVASSLDLLRFPPGGVLVVKSPYPDWAVLVNRATAIVSETGQAAAHLATVAREFGVPALFGVENAFSQLANGQLVTVDATGRRIHAGRVEGLLNEPPAKPPLMRGSPIEQLLQEVLRHITPLNLTNPASPYFRASACRTLHDLTRFCHEKAVQEMFRFGERHSFAARSARQLVVETPFQWWVIDLDDGFAPERQPDKYFIHLHDIRSTPMLALWRGMTAIPWAGPPPVDLGGLGSIIFQSTRNPRLDPAVRSTLTARNYFLVAKNFCNLSVRLGYHLALAEANLSEYLTESYISFQFKGGAADSHRRLLRVGLLGEILAAFDFRVEIKGDTLTARIEKRPRAYLEDRLMVLGYLLIHTRQIDMVMADEVVRDQYRTKILADLAQILPNHNALARGDEDEQRDQAAAG